MSDYNFNSPSRQSARGIIIILGYNLYNTVRAIILLILAYFVKYIQSDSNGFFSFPKIILGALLFFFFFLIIAILRYQNFKFFINDSAFILQKGIINKEVVSINKSKIQNIYIKQNLLQQIMNVVSLSIETAGDDDTEIEIKALERPKALALKKLLLNLDTLKDTQIDETAEIKHPVFFKASIKKLLLEGISENHFRSFLLISAFIVSIYRDIEVFFTEIEINSKFDDWLQLDEQSLFDVLFLNLSIALILLLFSFVLSLIVTVIKNFNLTVTRKSDGFEISKGLFNKLNLSLKTPRIQTVTILTNRFKSTLGLFQLAFTQAMLSKDQKQKFKIIGLNKVKIDTLVLELFPSALKNTITKKPDRYMIYRVYYIAMIPCIALNLVFYLTEPIYFLINIPIIVVLILHAVFRYRKTYLSTNGELIIIGGGNFINTTTTYLEIHKIQAVTLTQTLFQKRRQLASLKLVTAGKTVKIMQVDLKDAYHIKNYCLYKIETTLKDWM